jgi:hypothetical protein
MARRTLPAAPVAPLVPWQRWGVCEEGTAAIGAVALKTVHRFQRLAAQRAETHHRQSVQHVEVEGVPWDAAPAQLRPHQGAWGHTALALGRGVLLWVAFGPRTQATAAARSAPGVARPRQRPRLLTDGWKASTAALLQGVGSV